MILPLIVCAGSLANPIPKPQVEYRLRVDSTDLTGVAVELEIRNAPAAMTLAAPAHPEYDDRYWRFVERLEARGPAGAVPVAREDSVLWHLSNPAGDLLVRYRVRFPVEPLPRAAWRPFLASTGGLIGGPHTFLYPLGLERMSARVVLKIPMSWSVGTALEPAGDRTYRAPDLHALMESPLQVGLQSEWRFGVNGIPHRVFYWRLPDARPFDTTAFAQGIERVTRATMTLFGVAPYRAYTFLFQDGAYGGLEHPASATLGAPSATLAGNPHALLLEIAHEFFHTWNLMHIKPAEYRGLDYRTQPPVAGLWFSEGLTLFYADLLARRAGLPTPHPTRAARLESLIARYLANPGHARFSAEAISRVAYNAGPAPLGDYSVSAHLIGELLGMMLDLAVRDATGGSRSMDDVMRGMNERFGKRGFTSRDVQRVAEDVCRCRVGELFDRHIVRAGPIEIDRYLAVIGMRGSVRWEPARDPDGRPSRDLRVFGYNRSGDDTLRLVITNPESVWGRAGLHSHDPILAVNGQPVPVLRDLRAAVSGLGIGDSASVTVVQEGRAKTVRFVMSGYDRPVVRLESLSQVSVRQRRLLRDWMEGR